METTLIVIITYAIIGYLCVRFRIWRLYEHLTHGGNDFNWPGHGTLPAFWHGALWLPIAALGIIAVLGALLFLVLLMCTVVAFEAVDWTIPRRY